MNWVVITGVVIALMFLVGFTNWFYHLAIGIDALIIEDFFVGYRMFFWGIGAISFMVFIFWANAVIAECPTPKEEREGLFAYLDCRAYDSFKASRWGYLLPTPTPEEGDEPVDETKEEAPTYPGNP